MIYINANKTNHEIIVIHREFVSPVNLFIWHELTNEKTDIGLTSCALQNGYTQLVFNFNFLPNANYTIEIFDYNNPTNLIFRGKIKTYE